jgi:acetyl esterase/lipase
MSATTGPPAPIPTGISEAAQRTLALPPVEVSELPALDDTEEWLKQIELRNSFIARRFAEIELPVAAEERQVAGVHTYVLRPEGVTDETPIYLDIHGGALVFGGGDLCRLMGSGSAMASGMLTWSVDYRMPPLHPYPAALDDCMAVYRALLDVRDPADIFVGGGSAGGNLAAALMVRARDEGLPMPAALALSSPEVDLTESGDTFHTLAAVSSPLSSLMKINLLYANGHDLADPYLSPLFADLTGFPPTLLQTGTRDLFLSNTVRMHRNLLAAGAEADLHVFEAMPHGGFDGTTPEDDDLRTTIRRFLDRHRRSG